MAAIEWNNPDFDLAVQFVCHTSRPVFLTGKAGTGKTTFLKYIREYCSKKIAVVAPTGVAAMNAGGVTMHSFFQLPLGPYLADYSGGWGATQMEWANRHTLLKNLRISSSKRQLIRELELLVIDEVSMLRADMLDAIDAVLRHLRQRPSIPFGGIQVLFIGDLYQLPPVVGREEWQLLSARYKSPFFFDAQVLSEYAPVHIELKTIYRQQDTSFIRVLNAIRNNEAASEDLELLHRCYRPGFQPPASGPQYIMLTSHNARADKVNREELDRLNSKMHVFEGQTKGDFGEKTAPVEKNLLLKEGAQIMFVKNDKGENRRYYNGKIGTISKIDSEQILVHFPEEDTVMELEKEIWRNISYRYNAEQDEVEEEELGSFSQYPVRLAWAITIHKSQGLTFSHAIVDAGAAFAPGQVYVALSRLRGMEGLVLQTRINTAQVMTDERVVRYTQLAGLGKPEHTLNEEQQRYASNVLLESFHMDALLESVSDWYKGMQDMNIPEKPKALLTASGLQQSMQSLHDVAAKFIRQLESLLQEQATPDRNLLQERTVAAAAYFERELNLVLQILAEHRTAWKVKPRTKKYLGIVDVLHSQTERKKTQVNAAAALASGWQKGSNIGTLLQEMLVRQKEKPAVAAEPAPAKKEKGSSNRLSLELYLEGKKAEEIAEIRSMAISTVEGHLVSFIPSGEVDIYSFVTNEQLSQLLKAIQQHGTHAGTLKEQLGPAFTYTQIRAAIAWQQRMSTEG